MSSKLVAGVLAAALSACTTASSPAPLAPAETAAEPPAILTGEGRLDCTINSRENGAQKLVLSKGNGLEFEVVVSPIVNGVVQTKGPEKGGSYRFSSHLAKPGRGVL